MTKVDAGPSHSPKPMMGVWWLNIVDDDATETILIGPERGGNHLQRSVIGNL